MIGVDEPLIAAALARQTVYRDPVEDIRRIEIEGRARSRSIRLTANEWYNATRLGDSYWLYVVWVAMDEPRPGPLCMRNPAKHLDHAKKEAVAAGYYNIWASAVEEAA